MSDNMPPPDLLGLSDSLTPEADADRPAHIHTAVVTAVNADGTVDVSWSDGTIGSVDVLEGATAAVGDAVQMLSRPERPLVLGTVGQPGPAGLRQVVTFTTSGSFVKATFPWLRAVRVTVVGAGGGGGGAEGGAGQACGGAGGGGGTARELIAVAALAASETVTVGAAGSGGASGNNNGTDGGTTSFGGHCSATGGTGGDGGANTAAAVFSAGGTGGAGAGGDVNFVGGDGMNGRVIDGTWVGGLGGASIFGGDQRNAPSSAQGASAQTYGAGGAMAVATGTSRSGGNGFDGLVIVELYA